MKNVVHPHVFQQQARMGELLYLGATEWDSLRGYVVIDVKVSDTVSHGEATRRMSVAHMGPDGQRGVVTLINPQILDDGDTLRAYGENGTVMRAMRMGPLYLCTGCDACRD